MSEHFITSLAVLRKAHLASCHGEEAARTLAGEPIPRHPDHRGDAPPYQYLGIASQGDWFRQKLLELQALSGVQVPAFLCAQAPTHEHLQVYKDDGGKVVFREVHCFYRIQSGWDAHIAAIGQLRDWCQAHPEEASDVLETSAQDLHAAIASQFFTLKPDREGLGEGDNPEFFFSVLYTIEELLRTAKAGQDDPDQWVLYHWTK